jgi:hypothetical protein
MSLPGFSATNSLGPAAHAYYGAASLSAAQGDEVNPEFLGVIKEMFESASETVSEAVEMVSEAVSGALKSGFSSLSNLIKNLKDHGDQGQPFACGLWVTRMMSCTGTSPTFSEIEVLGACMSANPQYNAACMTISAALYPLLTEACQKNPSALSGVASQVCQGA